MVTSPLQRLATLASVACLLLTPRVVWSDIDGVCGGWDQETVETNCDEQVDGGGSNGTAAENPFAAGPGGSTGGTIGSLPMNVNPLTSTLSKGVLASYASLPSSSLLTFKASTKAGVAGFGWLVNGKLVSMSGLSSTMPMVTFAISEIGFSNQAYGSMILVFLGVKGQVLAAVDLSAISN